MDLYIHSVLRGFRAWCLNMMMKNKALFFFFSVLLSSEQCHFVPSCKFEVETELCCCFNSSFWIQLVV